MMEALWYGSAMRFAAALTPLEWLYRAVMRVRDTAYQWGLRAAHRAPIPVIVVGNVAVGGTGKTPLVIWLVQLLSAEGYRPGVICRGYGGNSRSWPQLVCAGADPRMVGDEAVLLAQRLQCPVAAGPDRLAAIHALLTTEECDVVVSDDGLQHVRLARDIEIAVVDAERVHGNGHCLPAGPLREPLTRLDSVDAVVVNGKLGTTPNSPTSSPTIAKPAHAKEFCMRFSALAPQHLLRPTETRSFEDFALGPVHALAGIGHPGRFFRQLRELGLTVIEHPFADHHRFVADDLAFDDALPILMTEKDAVKCGKFADERCWFVRIETTLGPTFGPWMLDKMRHLNAPALRS